jgi:hypothetical protein
MDFSFEATCINSLCIGRDTPRLLSCFKVAVAP